MKAKRGGRFRVILGLASLIAPVLAHAADPFDRITEYVDGYRDIAAFDGVVLIAEGDEIVWQAGFGEADYRHNLPMTVDAVFRIASLSKQVTEAAIGRLVDAGAVRMDDPLSKFLPDFPAADRITIRQLVDHTAGIAHTNRLDWMDMKVGMTLDDIVAGLAREPLLFPPGEGEQYSNGGYALLARVIEIASGQRFAQYIRDQFAGAYPSIGHESALAVVPGMADRYAPGPIFGERVEARTYITANRIGGGSLYADAGDVYRFFRDCFAGRVVSAGTTSQLFRRPDDGDIRITGRSPGALAQVYLDFDHDLTVVTLSSNSAWPAGFNADIVALYRGDTTSLASVRLAAEQPSAADAVTLSGHFKSANFGWDVEIRRGAGNLVFMQDDIRTAFAQTTDGDFFLPLYDWLCTYADDGQEFVCRQRDQGATIRFRFTRS